MEIIKYQFQQHGDDRGNLTALEEGKEIPFSIKRVYYMYDTGEGVRRGYHAHKALEQILVCVHGECKILLDDGKEKKIAHLDKPYEGIYLAHNIWREMYVQRNDGYHWPCHRIRCRSWHSHAKRTCPPARQY